MTRTRASSEDSVVCPDFGFGNGGSNNGWQSQKSVVICGSGIGISIVVNRFPAVGAALCINTTMARLSRKHNNANVLALGNKFIRIEVARECVKHFPEYSP